MSTEPRTATEHLDRIEKYLKASSAYSFVRMEALESLTALRASIAEMEERARVWDEWREFIRLTTEVVWSRDPSVILEVGNYPAQLEAQISEMERQHAGSPAILSASPDGSANRESDAFESRGITERAKLLSLFPQPIYVEEIPNGYCGPTCCPDRPWFVVTTRAGRIKIGWRKRVIAIDWSDSAITATAEELFPREDVTKDGKLIHAWGYDKAREYIAALPNPESQTEDAPSSKGLPEGVTDLRAQIEALIVERDQAREARRVIQHIVEAQKERVASLEEALREAADDAYGLANGEFDQMEAGKRMCVYLNAALSTTAATPPHRVVCWKCGTATRSDSDHCQYCDVLIEEVDELTGRTGSPASPSPSVEAEANRESDAKMLDCIKRSGLSPEEFARRYNEITPGSTVPRPLQC